MKQIEGKKIMGERAAGILLPVASLNGDFGIGDFSDCAYNFINIISNIGFKIWQILPLNPVGYGNSPYQPYSSYAGDEIYIDLKQLKRSGLIKSELKMISPSNKIDYHAARELKEKYLKEAFCNFKKDEFYERFSEQKNIFNYALYMTFKKSNSMLPWQKWDKEMKWYFQNDKIKLEAYSSQIEYEIFVQYMFWLQWQKLKKYANEKHIRIMGDIPLYVGSDSQDVWQENEAFLLGSDGNPSIISGVPPDYFSEDGQLWGNPIYNWDYIEREGFKFWINRLSHASKLYNIIRLDHFRGFDTYWTVKAGSDTAKDGQWLNAPGEKLFDLLKDEFGTVEIVAEDLGFLREEVFELRDRYGFKGMKVLQFCMDSKAELEDFENRKNIIAYTGTHDNQTIKGWQAGLSTKQKSCIKKMFFKRYGENQDLITSFLKITFGSRADYAIAPLADIAGLDDKARINTPGTLNDNNWSYKYTSMDLLEEKRESLREILKQTGRIEK